MKFVDFDPIGVCTGVKADGNQLNNDLFNQVENGANKYRDDNFVHCVFPFFDRFTAIKMMVDHGRQERDLYSQPPEKERQGQFQFFAKVAIFFGVVGENGGDNAENRRKAFRSDLDIVSASIY